MAASPSSLYFLPTGLSDPAHPKWGCWGGRFRPVSGGLYCDATDMDRMIFFGETILRRAVGEFVSHYHRERNHQGLGNRLIEAGEEVGRCAGAVECRERLGGMLRYYYRQAA